MGKRSFGGGSAYQNIADGWRRLQEQQTRNNARSLADTINDFFNTSGGGSPFGDLKGTERKNERHGSGGLAGTIWEKDGPQSTGGGGGGAGTPGTGLDSGHEDGGGAGSGAGDGAGGSESGDDLTGTPFTMNGTTYSALDLENMLRDPGLFSQEWLRTQGKGTPTMIGALGNFPELLPMLSMLLSNPDQQFLEVDDAGNVLNGEALNPANAAARYQQLLQGVTTPGGYTPDGMSLVEMILGTPGMNMEDTPSYLQGATQLTPEGAAASGAQQAASTNALINAALAYSAPGMRGLTASLLNWMGQQYLSDSMDARTADAEGGRPAYVEWLAQNARNEWGVS